MKKILLVNLGAAVACGGGAVGIAYAVTHKLQEDKKTTVADINNIFQNIQTLYGGQAQLQAVTDANYNSLYTFIQQSIAGTVASLTTSQDKALALQKAELTTELNNIKAALDAHAHFDSETFSAIYTAIEGMNSRLESISDLQVQFENKFNILKSDYQTTATNLWDAVDLLKNATTSSLLRFESIEATLNNVQAKLLDVDSLRSMILSTQQVVAAIEARVTALEAKVQALNDSQYDDAALKAAIQELKDAQANMDAKVTAIEGAIDSIWTHVNNIYAEIDKLKNKQTIVDADLATIKTEIDSIKTIQGQTTGAQAQLLAQLNAISSKVDSLFVNNTTLQNQVNWLNDQNTQLYQNFLYLQSAIHNLEQLYYTGSSTTVSIKPSDTDTNFVIYEKTSGNGTVRFPSIEVPRLNTAKRFAIYIKVTDTSANTSYVTQVIDAYPDYDYKLIGSSTQGFKNEQFLVSVGLDRGVDRININGLWMRKSSDAWKTSKDIDNTKVQITNVVVTY